MNLFPYTDHNKRYYTLDYYYRQKFGEKIVKVSLNAGFSCPNIDGTVGSGGCIYCSPSGSGDFAGNQADHLVTQFQKIKQSLEKKWPHAKYIGYFQAHTNTYAPLPTLKNCYETILKQKDVVGLAIATRPDAISEECMDYLESLSKHTFLTIELGLQTIHERTSQFINRCHSLTCFENCVNELRKRGISVVVHIINGLPYETKEMMIATTDYLNQLDIQGIKIHMLHILKHTKLGTYYQKKPFPILSKEDYVQIVCEQLERLRPTIVLHRITGDPDPKDLIEPLWLTKKFNVLNAIDQELENRKTFQGFQTSIAYAIQNVLSLAVHPHEYILNETKLKWQNLLPQSLPFKETMQRKVAQKGKYALIMTPLTYDIQQIETLLDYLHPQGTLLLLGAKEDADFPLPHKLYETIHSTEPILIEVRKKTLL